MKKLKVILTSVFIVCLIGNISSQVLVEDCEALCQPSLAQCGMNNDITLAFDQADCFAQHGMVGNPGPVSQCMRNAQLAWGFRNGACFDQYWTCMGNCFNI